MTREQAKELLPVIAAYAEGAIVEHCSNTKNHWYVSSNPNFNTDFKWRIRPKPLECWVRYHEESGVLSPYIGAVQNNESGWRNVKMREVVE